MGVVEVKVENLVEQNMMDYSAYAILQRAIPDLRDGLKPGQRRILYTMYKEKATKFTKSANIEGAVMKIHPHGSTYGTAVNMVQKDRNLIPLIEGKGNFAQVTSRDLQPGASRYTEMRLSEASIEMFKGLNKNIVDIIPNYDGSMTMPEVLPVKYPVLLTQPSKGIAVGMASNIPSFNVKELVNAIEKYIKEGKRNMLVPDFATGGYIVNNKEVFKNINLKGTGTIQLRGKAEIVGNTIKITEVPFSSTREAIIDKIIEFAKSGELKEVSSAKDLTGLKGMLVEVKAKRGTNMELLLEKLYQLTPLQSTFSTNLNVIVDKSPKVIGVWEAIDEWIKWRKETIIRGYTFDIDKLSKDLHFLRGLEKVLLDIDEAIEIIRRSKAELIEPNLMKKFNIDEEQAKEVADMKLRNINREYIINKIKDIEKLEETINDYKDLITNDERLDDEVIKGLKEISEKYGKDRQTKIININKTKIRKARKKLEEAPNYPVTLFVTKEGYIKKFQGKPSIEDQYVKPGDKIIDTFETWNRAELLVFSNSDKSCHRIQVSDIEETTNRALGVFAPSLCDAKDIIGYSVLDGKNKFIIIGYDNNKIAKIKLSSFESNRRRLANSLSRSAEAIGILTFSEEGTFIFKTTTTAFKIPTSKYDAKERHTQGVYGPRKGVLTEIRMAK